DIDAAKARREVAHAEVGRLEALRGYKRIRAPFDGVVTRRSVNTGDFVNATEKMALFSVARIDPVRVVVSVPEAAAGLVTAGQGGAARTRRSAISTGNPSSHTSVTHVESRSNVTGSRPVTFGSSDHARSWFTKYIMYPVCHAGLSSL